MKIFVSLMLNKLIYFLCIFSFAVNAQQVELETTKLEPAQAEYFDWSVLKKVWEDDIQFHGFLSQGLFHTTGNNVHGKSKNSVSAGLTEMGLNMSYQAFNKLSFVAQGLYRRAGKNTGSDGEGTLDFAFFDFTFFNFNMGRIGLRAGRVKNPWGFYNETRDVASTHPTILLPLVYFDRSRALFLALDGGQVYADYNSSIGDFSFKLNYGLINANDDELLRAITIKPAEGHLKGQPSIISQLNYEIMGGQYAFAISYAHVDLNYKAENKLDPYAGLKSTFDSFLLSAQYNGEKFSFTAEYNRQWNRFSGVVNRNDSTTISEYWYVQAGYRILDNLQTTIRYDSGVRDINDRSGERFHQRSGLPAYFMFTQDMVVGLRWNITPAWMLRADYSRVHGAGAVSLQDNPVISDLALNWNIYSVQIAFRF